MRLATFSKRRPDESRHILVTIFQDDSGLFLYVFGEPHDKRATVPLQCVHEAYRVGHLLYRVARD